MRQDPQSLARRAKSENQQRTSLTSSALFSSQVVEDVFPKVVVAPNPSSCVGTRRIQTFLGPTRLTVTCVVTCPFVRLHRRRRGVSRTPASASPETARSHRRTFENTARQLCRAPAVRRDTVGFAVPFASPQPKLEQRAVGRFPHSPSGAPNALSSTRTPGRRLALAAALVLNQRSCGRLGEPRPARQARHHRGLDSPAHSWWERFGEASLA
ncbi:hypothetical protein B0T18DRAFT_108354 [Schizothecium vesticola]|uniref:Uncharacterized protein n=1 Tax=Schizothecium vesticola TaxID=314040 RepID=A0AA40F1K4_9PEZI|nr:hypothetical protein B0T18DRAFT_108354 [Schizothecium vesticola]